MGSRPGRRRRRSRGLSLARGSRAPGGDRDLPGRSRSPAAALVRARHCRSGLRRFGRPDEPERVVLDRGPATRPRPRPARGPERLRRAGARDSAARARGHEAGGRRRSGPRRPDGDPRSRYRLGRGRLGSHADRPMHRLQRGRSRVAVQQRRHRRSPALGPAWMVRSCLVRARPLRRRASSISTVPTARWQGSSRRRTMRPPFRVSPRNRSTHAASPPSTSSSRFLGTFAGNLALTFDARGGVYLGGGIVPRLLERIESSSFRERFESKGRFRSHLERIPTSVIVDPSAAALLGANQALEEPPRSRRRPSRRARATLRSGLPAVTRDRIRSSRVATSLKLSR